MIDPINLLNNLPGLLIFKIGATEVCMDVKSVQTILDASPAGIDLIQVNRGPGILGTIKHLDFEYVVLDSMFFFNVRFNVGQTSKVILFNLFGKRIAVVADQIVEFITLDSLFIEQNVGFHVSEEKKYISWYLEYQNRKILYPNYEKIAKEVSSSGFFLSLLLA